MGDTDKNPPDFFPLNFSDASNIAEAFDNQLLGFLAILAVAYSAVSWAFFAYTDPGLIEFVTFLIITIFIGAIVVVGIDVWVKANLTPAERQENDSDKKESNSIEE